MTETIYARPAQYDLEHEGEDADVLFYLEFVRRRRPRRALELGCGSRRVTLPLAEAARKMGFEIVGIDPSEQMRALWNRSLGGYRLRPIGETSREIIMAGRRR